MDVALLTFGLPFAVIGFAAYRAAVRSYRMYRATRTVTCPETRRPLVVMIDATHAAVSSALGRAALRLRSCSRWPERRGCRQECLAYLRGPARPDAPQPAWSRHACEAMEPDSDAGRLWSEGPARSRLQQTIGSCQ